jgi:hypothetical protein
MMLGFIQNFFRSKKMEAQALVKLAEVEAEHTRLGQIIAEIRTGVPSGRDSD